MNNKNRRAGLLIIWMILVMCLCSCGSSSQGARNESEDKGESISINQLPYDNLTWDNQTFSMTDVVLCQQKVEHGYIPIVILEYDVSSLSEDDVYWLTKKDIEDLDSTSANSNFWNFVLLSSEKNDLDHNQLEMLYQTIENGKIYCLFADFSKKRYSFDAMSLS